MEHVYGSIDNPIYIDILEGETAHLTNKHLRKPFISKSYQLYFNPMVKDLAELSLSTENGKGVKVIQIPLGDNYDKLKEVLFCELFDQISTTELRGLIHDCIFALKCSRMHVLEVAPNGGEMHILTDHVPTMEHHLGNVIIRYTYTNQDYRKVKEVEILFIERDYYDYSRNADRIYSYLPISRYNISIQYDGKTQSAIIYTYQGVVKRIFPMNNLRSLKTSLQTTLKRNISAYNKRCIAVNTLIEKLAYSWK